MKPARIILSFTTAIILLAAAGCSTTRRIPEGELLYTGLKGLKVETTDSMRLAPGVKEVLQEAVDVEPTPKTLFVLPVGLWVYNNWSDSAKGIKGWIYNKLVKEPVLVSDVRPALRTKMLDEILDNNGYFRGTATYELVQPKNKKKAAILYTVNPGPVYTIDTLRLLPDTCRLNHLIDSIARRDPYLRPGERFCMDSLSSARTRIATRLQNRGYYFFRPEYIEYLADSLMNPGHIALQMTVASNIPHAGTLRYKTGKINVYTFRSNGGGTPDTTELSHGITLVEMKPSRLRKKLITENVLFREGKTFSVRDINRTQTYLSRLGIFNAINIEAYPDTTAAEPTLDVTVGCTFDVPLEAMLEVNASSKSNSYIGPGLIFGVKNHNAFGGGEQLGVQVNGSYEWQTGSGHKSIFNSYELGITGSLAFPRLLAPRFIPSRHRQLNWTTITLNANMLNRPHYFKMAQFNTSFAYDWRSSRYINNSLTLFKLTYTKLMHTTADFDSIMTANPAVALSFQSQYIPQISYTFVYDRRIDRDNTINVQFTVQEAGNIFWSIYELCGKHGEKKLFGTPFSQFVNGQAQAVWGRRVSGNNWLWSRIAIGAAHAYGNSAQVPYSEQFYCGGANSVRAFTVRSIGPGSYHDPADKDNDYFDQTGTFKFEANLEYRFPIFGPLHGAAFIDAGNVWLLKNDPSRPGGTLRAKSFFRDLALGTGVGLRFDIGMLVVRGDLGIGIHAPYDTGKRGYYNMESFGKSLAFHLAIGYPF